MNFPRSGCTTLTAFALAAFAAFAGCAPRECDGLSASQCEALRGMALPSSPPASSGNRFADDEQAALLGFALFFDARLSVNQQVRCATCHLPDRAFADGLPGAVGLAPVERNSPSLFEAAYHRWHNWDGRADSLWSQPLLALENVREMGFTRLGLAHHLFVHERTRYERVFGVLPPLDDAVRFPARGKPGEASWESMTSADRQAVDAIAANAGKAFEAYLRRIAFGPARFDRFVAGEATALDAEERRGLGVFFAAGCDGCHSGPALSDDAFHALRVPALDGAPVERGRAEALEVLRSSPFAANGAFSDAVLPLPEPTSADEGAFKTPGLRNLSRTAPYGHNGRFATLEEVVDFHLAGGGGADARAVGTVDGALVPVSLSASERSALLRFLSALDATDPPAPWADWPDR